VSTQNIATVTQKHFINCGQRMVLNNPIKELK